MKITVRKQQEKSGTRWVLDYTPTDGKRIRRFFKNRVECESAANEQKLLVRRAGEDWVALTLPERADLITAYARVKPTGLSMNQILDQWENGSGNGNGNYTATSLGEAGEAWIKNLEHQNRRDKHIKNCANWIKRFSKGREEMPVHKVTLADVKAWLEPFKMVTYNSYRDLARAFFNFAHQNKMTAEMVCDSKRLPKLHIDYVPPTILTPDQLKTALEFIANNKPEVLGFFALATFCGIRPEECDKMTWEMIDLDRGLIHLPATITKTRRPRLIHMHDTALAWVKVAREWDCCIGSRLVARGAKMTAVRDHLGFSEWPHDVLRHSFGSYYVELTHDLAKTALEMGNSPEIILRNYRSIVTPKATKEFWAMTPEAILTAGWKA